MPKFTITYGDTDRQDETVTADRFIEGDDSLTFHDSVGPVFWVSKVSVFRISKDA